MPMLAARIRDRLRLVQFAGDTVDATIGWALYPSDGRTAQTLLAQADGKLLAAKHAPGVIAAAPGAEPAETADLVVA